MRDFCIGLFSKIIDILVVLSLIGVLIGATFVYIESEKMGSPVSHFRAVIVLIGGALYVSFLAGALYLGLGVYHNTKRSAELLEAQLRGPAQTTRLF